MFLYNKRAYTKHENIHYVLYALDHVYEQYL